MGAAHMGDWLVGAYEGQNDKAVALFAGYHHVSPGEAMGRAHINIKEMGAIFEAGCK